MTFDAGSIESSLTVDRTPFQQGLDAAKAEARRFASERYTAKLEVDADTAKAKAKLDALGLTGNKRIKIDVDANTNNAAAKIAEVRRQTQGLGNDSQKAAKDSEREFHLLFDTLSTIGPALIPLSAGLAGISSAAVGVGVDLLLAVKGASKEMAQGTYVGRQYTAQIADLSGGVSMLQRTAADGVLKPFENEVDRITAKMPQLNQFVRETARDSGQIAARGADTLLNLFLTAGPLIKTAEDDIDSMLNRLDNWSMSADAKAFFNSLASDIPQAVDTLGNVFGILGHVVQAAAPVGHIMLDLIDESTGLLSLLTRFQPVAQLVVTTFVAWRTATLLSTIANKLAGSTAVETTAAVANETAGLAAQAAAAERAALAMNALGLANARVATTGALAGWGGMRVATGAGAPLPIGGAAAPIAEAGLFSRIGAGASSVLSKSIIPAVAAYFGTSALANLAHPWASSTNPIKAGIGQGTAIARDIFTGHWGSILGETNANNPALQAAADQRNYNAQMGINHGGITAPGIGAYYAKTMLNSNFEQNRQTQVNQQLSNVGQMADPQKISSASDAITTSLQRQITVQQKLFDTSGRTITLNNGLKVSWDAYRQVIDSTGMDLTQTTAYFQQRHDAMLIEQDGLDKLGRETKNYNQFLADTSGKYKLTSDQATLYGRVLGLNFEKIGKNRAAEFAAATAVGAVGDAFKNSTPNVQQWLDTVGKVDPETATLTDKVALLGSALEALRPTTLDAAGANLSAAKASEDAANAIAQNSKSISKNGDLLGQLVKVNGEWIVQQPKLTAGSLGVQQAMASAGSTAIQLAQSIYQNTGNAHEALNAYEGLRQQFISTETQAGKTAGAAENLATQIFGVPKDASTFVKLLNQGNVTAAIRSLTSKLTDFSSIIATALLDLDAGQFNTTLGEAKQSLRDIENSRHAITLILNPLSPGNVNPDPNLAALTGQNDKNKRGKGGARGRRVTEGTTPTADDVLVPVSKGEWIINARQSEKHDRLLRAINSGTHGFAAGGRVGDPPSLITDPGKGDGSGSGSGSDSGSGDASKTNSSLDHFISLLFSDSSSFHAIGSASVRSVRRIIRDLRHDIEQVFKAGFTDQTAVDDFKHATDRLVSEAQRRKKTLDEIADEKKKYSKIKSLTSQVKSAMLGAFDPGTSGNGYQRGILESLTQDTDDAEHFEHLRKRAEALGLDPRLIEQITKEGPAEAAKNLQAIVGGGKNYVSRLDKEYDRYHQIANRVANQQSRDKYGRDQAEEQKRIRHLTEKANAILAEERDEIKKIRAEIATLRRDLKTKKRKV